MRQQGRRGRRSDRGHGAMRGRHANCQLYLERPKNTPGKERRKRERKGKEGRNFRSVRSRLRTEPAAMKSTEVAENAQGLPVFTWFHFLSFNVIQPLFGSSQCSVTYSEAQITDREALVEKNLFSLEILWRMWTDRIDLRSERPLLA